MKVIEKFIHLCFFIFWLDSVSNGVIFIAFDIMKILEAFLICLQEESICAKPNLEIKNHHTVTNLLT